MFDVFPEPHDPVQGLKVVSNRLVVEPKFFPFTLLNICANIMPRFWEKLFYCSGIVVVLEKAPNPINKG